MSDVDPQHEYLGDGVYASFDGYHVWLRTGSHDAEPAIALEPDVLTALLRYQRRVIERAQRLAEIDTAGAGESAPVTRKPKPKPSEPRCPHCGCPELLTYVRGRPDGWFGLVTSCPGCGKVISPAEKASP